MSKEFDMGKYTVFIIQMDQHFLYLPIYFAKHKGFFGYVPDEYEIDFKTSLERTDISAYEELMLRRTNENEIKFAITDPTVVINRPLGVHEPSPVILAAMITNAAFWAVDHRAHEIKHFSDLGSFDKVIAYHPGTTSYGIAARVLREAGKDVSELNIKTVNRGEELLALTYSEHGTVAISPDILEIDALIDRGGNGT